MRILLAVLAFLLAGPVHAQNAFEWPDGRRVAVSLSFDDGRASQVDVGLDLFARFDVDVTFFVVPGAVEQRLEAWRRAVRDGHEIGNHSLVHPCSGNFAFVQDDALETYTLAAMEGELAAANLRLDDLLGVTPDVFAYPCGQKFVGRGTDTRSYVPVVAETFVVGRGWLDEATNDPSFVDMAQVMGTEMDGKSFESIRDIIEAAEGRWIVFAGHEIGAEGRQTTRVEMLEELFRYAEDPANGVWLTPVGTAARYILNRR